MNMFKRWQPAQVFLRPPLAVARPDATTAALAAWAQWCAQHRGRACELALSGHWLMSGAATPEQAAQQWDHYLGVNAQTLDQAWVQRSVVVPWSLSCAAPRELIDGLQKTAREHAVKLRWVGPWWARDAQRWLAEHSPSSAGPAADQTWQAKEPGLTTYFKMAPDVQGKAALAQVWTESAELQPLPGVSARNEVIAPSSVEALVTAWPQPQAASWAALRPASWSEALDFVGPRVRVALWSWAVLVGGLAACMAVSEQAQQSLASRDEAQAQWRRLERAQHQQALARAQPRAAKASESAAAPTLDDDTARKAARVAQLLAYPWAAVIERVEQSAQQERAVLTGFSLDIGSLGGSLDARPQLRLQAALRDDASALRWVAALGEGAQMLGRDALSTPFDTMQGHYALRGEAVWSAGVQP
jgi:hypothetical protein